MPLKVVDEFNVSICCPLRNEIYVLLYLVIIIPFQAISWPTHYDNVIHLGEEHLG
jgi:membrane-anchored glycerophosphoryl diester phosphodiesterase (GDPDase)